MFSTSILNHGNGFKTTDNISISLVYKGTTISQVWRSAFVKRPWLGAWRDFCTLNHFQDGTISSISVIETGFNLINGDLKGKWKSNLNFMNFLHSLPFCLQIYKIFLQVFMLFSRFSLWIRRKSTGMKRPHVALLLSYSWVFQDWNALARSRLRSSGCSPWFVLSWYLDYTGLAKFTLFHASFSFSCYFSSADEFHYKNWNCKWRRELRFWGS